MRRSHDLPTSLVPYAVISVALGGFGMALFQPVPVVDVPASEGCGLDHHAVLIDQPILHAPPGQNEAKTGCELTVELSAPGAQLMLQRVAPERTEPVLQQLGMERIHTFDRLDAGTYQLTVGGAGLPLSGARPFVCVDSERGSRRIVFAPSSHRVTGRLLGHRGQAPAGVELRLEQPIGAKDSVAGPLLVPVDASGTFDVLLPEGRYIALVTAPHHRALRQELNVTDRTAAVLRLDHEPLVRGQVVDASGQPVPGAEVFLNTGLDPRLAPTRTVADALGRFALPAHSQGRVRLAARSDAMFGTAALGRIRTLEGVDGVEIVARKGRSVSGYVQTRTGRIKPHAAVRYRVKGQGIVGTVEADDEGRFTVGGLPPDDVELWAEGSAIGAWGGAVATSGMSKVLLTWVPPAYKQR
jgi:hypothetical protein